MTRKNKNTPNVIEMVPAYKAQFETQGDLVILFAPKFRNKFLTKHLMPRMKQPYYKVDLDVYGTSVWNLIDGRRTVFEIGKKLEEIHGDSVAPVFERLGLFMNMLAQRHFITLSSAG